MSVTHLELYKDYKLNSVGAMMSNWEDGDVVKYVGHSLQHGGKYKSWVFVKEVTGDDWEVKNIEQILGEFTYDYNLGYKGCDTVDEIPVIIE